jgi:hypothetical protein
MSNKYCIYKKPWGDVEAWEYIDDLDEAMSFWYVRDAIDKYGIEETMPICMNKCGGYHTFNKKECIGIIESDTWPSLSSHYDLFKIKINHPKFDYGWIDTLGNTYLCSYMEHASLASELVTMNYPKEYTEYRLKEDGINAPDEFLLNKGWIKVLRGNPAHIFYDSYVTDVALSKLLEVENKKNG